MIIPTFICLNCSGGSDGSGGVGDISMMMMCVRACVWGCVCMLVCSYASPYLAMNSAAASPATSGGMLAGTITSTPYGEVNVRNKQQQPAQIKDLPLGRLTIRGQVGALFGSKSRRIPSASITVMWSLIF